MNRITVQNGESSVRQLIEVWWILELVTSWPIRDIPVWTFRIKGRNQKDLKSVEERDFWGVISRELNSVDSTSINKLNLRFFYIFSYHVWWGF